MSLRPAVLALLAAPGLACAAAPDLGALLGRSILEPNLPVVEVQVFCASRVPPMPPVSSAAQWTQEAARLRRHVLDEIVLRGEARAWAEAPSRVEWLDTITTGQGYRIRKLRYEAIPGLWIPALLYEPDQLRGKVAAVLNVNGHEKTGKFTPYIQERCINLAKRGLLALNPEWLGRGQMTTDGLSHYRMNQLDLCGTSGLAVFYLTLKRSLDLLLSLENTDANRVAVTGLSGGGWQTIVLAALDERVRLANPVAGYSSYVTRAQFPALDLGDSEQTPSDLASVVDYTHLTAMLAPRPALLTYNAKDSCCFRADYALAPLLYAAQPVFRLTNAADKLRHHVNHDPGHNYGRDNREAFYRMLRDHFFGGSPEFPVADIPSEQEVRTAEQLHVPIPEGNLDFHQLALRLSADLPRAGSPGPARLKQIVRMPDYEVFARSVEAVREGGLEVTRWRLRLNGDWTVPAVEITPAAPKATVLVVGDAGRAALGASVQALVEEGNRVVALDPFYFGESQITAQGGLFALLVAALGERPLGIQAGQVAATARWLCAARGFGPVTVISEGPRSGVFALVAAALEPGAIAAVRQRGAMTSLKEIVTRNLTVDRQPEQFCFGLLREFDLPQIAALVAPRPVVRVAAAPVAAPKAAASADPAARAWANAAAARPLLVHARRWLEEEVREADPESGLLMNSAGNRVWNTRDTASDVYPFFTWAARLLAPEVLEQHSRKILEFERTRTQWRGRLPGDYDPVRRAPVPMEAARAIFGASEYVKDGLVPIVELVGRGPWADRMREIEEDCFAFALWDTPAGRLPMNNLEVNGDHLQSLPRLFGLTGDRRYLAWAEQIAEQYFFHSKFRPVSLRDHNCEIVSGFALLWAVEKQIGSPLAARYEPALREMLDYIVDHGLTPDGLMHAKADPARKGPRPSPATADLSHNWGYNFTAFLCYADVGGQPQYGAVVERALRALADPKYHAAQWARGGFDRGLADSVEGAIYLLATRPVPEAERWVDSEAGVLDRLQWPLDKFGANIVRTALLYARTQTRGTWIHPWREDVTWGAAEQAGGLTVTVRADRAWRGRLTCDTARHRTIFGFTRDYPRINYLPAHFIVEPAARYRVALGGAARTMTGAELSEGLPLELAAGAEVVVTIAPEGAAVRTSP